MEYHKNCMYGGTWEDIMAWLVLRSQLMYRSQREGIDWRSS